VVEPTTDELLDGLPFRDFLVLVMHETDRNPRSLRSLMQLRRGLFFVRSAEQRLAARGLLRLEEGRQAVTPDGTRAVRTGAVLFELERFDASRH
jgi:hypothetical protein